jgi:hypothetical protein
MRIEPDAGDGCLTTAKRATLDLGYWFGIWELAQRDLGASKLLNTKAVITMKAFSISGWGPELKNGPDGG